MLKSTELELTISGFAEQVAAFIKKVETAREVDRIRFDEAPWTTSTPPEPAPNLHPSLAAHLWAANQWSANVAHVIEGPTRRQGGRKMSYTLDVFDVPLSAIEQAARHHKWLTFRATYEMVGQEFEATFSRGGWQFRKAPDEYLSVEKAASDA